MNTYRIASKAGQYHGEYQGQTPAEALAALHRDAGYHGVHYNAEDDRIIWPSEETRGLCGDVGDWVIEEAEGK